MASRPSLYLSVNVSVRPLVCSVFCLPSPAVCSSVRSPVHLSVCPYIFGYPSGYPYVYLSDECSCTSLSVRLSIGPLHTSYVHSSICPFLHLSVGSSICPSVQLPVCLYNYLSVRTFMCPSLCDCVHMSICSFACASVRPVMGLSMHLSFLSKRNLKISIR